MKCGVVSGQCSCELGIVCEDVRSWDACCVEGVVWCAHFGVGGVDPPITTLTLVVWLRRPRWWGRPWVRIALKFHQIPQRQHHSTENSLPTLHLRARSTPPPTSQPLSRRQGGIKEERESAWSALDKRASEKKRRRGSNKESVDTSSVVKRDEEGPC